MIVFQIDCPSGGYIQPNEKFVDLFTTGKAKSFLRSFPKLGLKELKFLKLYLALFESEKDVLGNRRRETCAVLYKKTEAGNELIRFLTTSKDILWRNGELHMLSENKDLMLGPIGVFHYSFITLGDNRVVVLPMFQEGIKLPEIRTLPPYPGEDEIENLEFWSVLNQKNFGMFEQHKLKIIRMAKYYIRHKKEMDLYLKLRQLETVPPENFRDGFKAFLFHLLATDVLKDGLMEEVENVDISLVTDYLKHALKLPDINGMHRIGDVVTLFDQNPEKLDVVYNMYYTTRLAREVHEILGEKTLPPGSPVLHQHVLQAAHERFPPKATRYLYVRHEHHQNAIDNAKVALDEKKKEMHKFLEECLINRFRKFADGTAQHITMTAEEEMDFHHKFVNELKGILTDIDLGMHPNQACRRCGVGLLAYLFLKNDGNFIERPIQSSRSEECLGLIFVQFETARTSYGFLEEGIKIHRSMM